MIKIVKVKWFAKMMNEIKKTPAFKKEMKLLEKEWGKK